MVARRQLGLGKVQQRSAVQVETEAIEHLASLVEDARFDDALVDVEPHVTYIGIHQILLWQAPRAAPVSRRASRHEAWSTSPLVCFTAEGPNGNYLFELEAQPGGPEGAQIRRRARSP